MTDDHIFSDNMGGLIPTYPSLLPRINYNYYFEGNRLQNDANWTVPSMDSRELVASDHRRWRPNIRFVRQIPCDTIPVGEDSNAVPPSSPRNRDIWNRDNEFRPNTSREFPNFLAAFLLSSNSKFVTPKNPAHPAYACYAVRLKTFDTWPKIMPPTKEQLADAGFYYTGTNDETRCFHCGGGLKVWGPKNNPWTQHAKMFKNCYYLLMVKGQIFIDSAIGKPAILPSREGTTQINLPSYVEGVEIPTAVDFEAIEQENASQPTQNTEAMLKRSSYDSATMCKICYNEELGVVFLPCGHLVTCTKCAPNIKSCAVCREPVTMTVRAIIS